MNRFKGTIAALAMGALFVGAGTASADGIITTGDGQVTVGVNALGGLFNFDGGGITGINLSGVGDALTPGCLCEGWGVSYGATTGNVYAGGSAGSTAVTGVSFATDGATFATSVTRMGDLEITQAYAHSASGALIENTVTIKNVGVGAVADVRYARNMDWDVPPTTFSEFVTIQRGGSTALLHSSDDGFSNSNPLTTPGGLACVANSDYNDCGPADHGAWFGFGFGGLAAGDSKSFSIFYGAARSEAAAIAALIAVAAEVYSLGQSNGGQLTGEPGTYIFGFSGVGGTAIPEPAMMLLTGVGLAAAAYRRRSRKA